ncbi:MAG: dicarboxylate/amino acid:cation symporter, partial [Micrococcales bacterium]|nr:dicarboxylate/amino acid:cation symporter [Micrococcales bacterium]
MSLILIGAIVIGGAIGVIFGPDATVLQPIGQLFLNALFMVVTPLVFFCIAASVASISGTRRFGNIAASIVVVFVATSVVAGVIGLIGFVAVPPLAHSDVAAIQSQVGTTTT